MQALRSLGIAPANFITLYSSQIGSAMEVILLSFALADRINSLKAEIVRKQIEQERLKREQEQEKKRIIEEQKEQLEIQVQERTAEVLNQKEEIQQQRD